MTVYRVVAGTERLSFGEEVFVVQDGRVDIPDASPAYASFLAAGLLLPDAAPPTEGAVVEAESRLADETESPVDEAEAPADEADGAPVKRRKATAVKK